MEGREEKGKLRRRKGMRGEGQLMEEEEERLGGKRRRRRLG